jgi:hypothetical protein
VLPERWPSEAAFAICSGRGKIARMPECDFTQGKWFVRVGYHVFPLALAGKLKNLADQRAPIAARRAPVETENPTSLSKTGTLEARAQAQAFDQQLRKTVKEMVELTLQLYNRQLRWSLRDLRANSVDEGLSISKEFLELAYVASGEFGWSTHPLPEGMHWKQHCWKHIHETDLKRVADDVEAGRQPFNDAPLGLLGSSEEALKLFRRAARCEPGAVARLHHLFPLRCDLEDMADYLFCGVERPEKTRRIIASIPSVEELAGRYAAVLVRHPDSKEAEHAQRDLDILTSKSAAKGSGGRAGRTRSGFGKDTVAQVYMMSYALFKQLKEVDRFLEGLNGGIHWNDEARNQQLRKLYPLLAGLLKSGEIMPPRRGDRSTTPCKIAGAVLGVSPSKVAKIVYE